MMKMAVNWWKTGSPSLCYYDTVEIMVEYSAVQGYNRNSVT